MKRKVAHSEAVSQAKSEIAADNIEDRLAALEKHDRIEQLLSELEEAQARMAQLRSQMGLGEEGGLLESDRLSPEARARIKDAIERDAEEFRRQAAMQVDLHSGQADRAGPHRQRAVAVDVQGRKWFPLHQPDRAA